MRLHILLYLTLLAIILSGCKKAQFSVEASLKGGDGRNLQFIYLASGKKQAFMMEQSAAVMNEKLSMQGVTARPTIVTIYSPDFTELSSFYAEAGDKITITGEMAQPAAWKISGNKINEEWTQWRLNNLPTLKSKEPRQLNAAVKKYVEKNPDNPLSTILLMCVYSRRNNEKGFQRLYSLLSEKARPKRLMEALGRADAQFPVFAYPVKKLGWRTLGDTIDSIAIINPKNATATILYFNDRETARDNDIRHLRSLRKDLPDSTLALVDVYLGADTIGLASRLASDSIKTITRTWAFGGVTHPIVEKLGIKSIPYFIVLDSKGTQKYRGASAEAAAKEAKKLQKESSKISSKNAH